jgi:dihydroxyacid dehydratase/phosphogluconate dehydratase
MLSKIDEIKARIELRSQLTRSKYLEEVDEWKKKSPNRNSSWLFQSCPCFAACNKNSQSSDLNSKKFVGIITAYNDMLVCSCSF